MTRVRTLHTELASFGTHRELLGILPESRYITSAPTAQKTPLYYVNVCTESVHSNGRGDDSSEFIAVLLVAQQRAIKTRSSIVSCVPTCLLIAARCHLQ
jgi:hypothetical protein